MSSPQDLLTVVFFLVTAVITAQLAGRLRSQVEATKLSQRRTQNLYEFNRRVAGAAGQDDVLWAVAYHVASTLKGKALVLLPQDDRLVVKGGYPPEDVLDSKSEAAAQWAWSHGQRAGRGSETLPAADWLFVPLKTHRGPVGVLGVQMDEQTLLTPDHSRLLDTLADQAALAFERTKLVADVEAAEIAQEKEQLRTALLSSLSHDLRTPLVSILGSATSLLTYEDQLAGTGAARARADHPGGGRAAEPLRPEPPGHDPAGRRRAEAARRLGRPARRRQWRARPRPPAAQEPRTSRSTSTRSCRFCSSTPC